MPTEVIGSPLRLSNMRLSSFLLAPREETFDVESANVAVKFLFLPGDVGAADTTALIKQLQVGLNQYENVKTLNIDGVYGPLTDAALKTAGFSSPLSKDTFEEIVSPPADNTQKPTASPSANGGKTPPKKMYWIPFGVKFSKNTAGQKALVWGIWLIMTAIVIWGGIVLFGEKEGKK